MATGDQYITQGTKFNHKNLSLQSYKETAEFPEVS